MNCRFDTAELFRIVDVQLPLLIGHHEKQLRTEKHEMNRRDLLNKIAAAQGAQRSVRLKPQSQLTPGEISVIERAARFAAHSSQAQITRSMPADEKARLRAEADSHSAIVIKIRQMRGLP